MYATPWRMTDSGAGGGLPDYLRLRRFGQYCRLSAELNRRPGWLAAVGPYVSVVCGHSDFIENAVFLSAVQAAAAAAQLRAQPDHQ